MLSWTDNNKEHGQFWLEEEAEDNYFVSNEPFRAAQKPSHHAFVVCTDFGVVPVQHGSPRALNFWCGVIKPN